MLMDLMFGAQGGRAHGATSIAGRASCLVTNRWFSFGRGQHELTAKVPGTLVSGATIHSGRSAGDFLEWNTFLFR